MRHATNSLTYLEEWRNIGVARWTKLEEIGREVPGGGCSWSQDLTHAELRDSTHWKRLDDGSKGGGGMV